LPDHHSDLVPTRPPGLVDVLDRILDKGLVIVGDIKISLAEVELLTLKIRLLVCSVDKAEQIGINWWRFDPNLTVPTESLSNGNDLEHTPSVLPENRATPNELEAGLSSETNGKTVAATGGDGTKQWRRSSTKSA